MPSLKILPKFDASLWPQDRVMKRTFTTKNRLAVLEEDLAIQFDPRHAVSGSGQTIHQSIELVRIPRFAFDVGN